jgi:hypothetical protein
MGRRLFAGGAKPETDPGRIDPSRTNSSSHFVRTYHCGPRSFLTSPFQSWFFIVIVGPAVKLSRRDVNGEPDKFRCQFPAGFQFS